MGPLALLGIGAGTSLLGGLFGSGKKVKVPQYQRTDVTAEQAKAIEGNLAVLPEAEKLAEKTNLFNQSQLMSSLRAAVPGIDAIQAQASENLASQLKGEIPQDVQEQIQRSGATKALYGGFGGSSAGRNLVARDLGLTSLAIADKALDSTSRWIATAKNTMVAPQLDVTSMFVSPSQRIAVTQSDNQAQFNRDMAAAGAAAAPNPTMAALGGVLSQAGGFALGKGLGGLTGPSVATTSPSTGGLEWGSMPSAPAGAGNSGYNAAVGGGAPTSSLFAPNGWYANQGWAQPQFGYGNLGGA